MYKISDIKAIILSKSILKDKNQEVKQLLLDSRKLSSTKCVLFFAIPGKRLDGHLYIEDLYRKGVRNFVVETLPKKELPLANILLVKNSIEALQEIAIHHREQFNFPLIGITGSNGKTIVKEWLYQLLNKDYKIVRSPKSFNSQIGVPLSVWNINKTNNLGIFEAGISEMNEMDNLQKIIEPEIGVFTNIGSAHGQNFINDKHKTKEKLKLFIRSKVLIYCKDHTTVNQSIADFWSHTINDNAEKPIFFTWSEKTQADIEIIQKEIHSYHSTITCVFKGQQISFEIPFTDKSSIENAIHCIAVMLYLKFPEKKINAKLKGLKRIHMRLEQKNGLNNSVIINDSYNSDLESLKIALEFLTQQQNSEKRTVILSDILQSGISGSDLYSSVAELIQSSKINKFIGIGKELFHHKYLFKHTETLEKTIFYASTDEFLEQEQDDHFINETILLKGARNFQFERINIFLEEKSHATVFEVDLNAIIHNLQFFTSKLKAKTKVMVMVKAFAYGAGSHEIAKLLEFHRVDYLGVAYADEGIVLRKSGIKTPIMVLNPEKRSFESMIKYHLEPEIYSLDLLKQFLASVKLANLKEAFPVHINIDTGMKRLGFDEKDIEWLGIILSSNKYVKVASIFSHLAASDEKQWKSFTEEQIEKFEKLYKQLADLIECKPIKHLVNSSGILNFKKAHFDMVRLGLGLYGVNDSKQKELIPAGTFKSTVSQIRDIKKEETIGYGRAGKLKKDGKIAIIAVGYADGLSRALSNGIGNVFVNGKLAPIVGNVCMDMTMIDISDIKNVEVGTEVEIFGKNIPVSNLAKQTNSITYEILTLINERVKRVFFME